jgi:type IX secretion system PorP/SprF family membrane protein
MNTKAQYIPLFSQYLSNGLVLNPAYAGSRDVLSLSFIYRDEWAGFSGAPIYETFSAHAPLKNDNEGVGFLFLNEKIGIEQNSQAYFNYSYRIMFNNLRLALGIKAGLDYFNFNWNNVYTNEPDKAFTSATNYFLFPNFGAGFYLYSDRYFLGGSIPYFLSYKSKASGGGYEFYNDYREYNYLIFGGYLFDFAKNFKIKPTTLIKYCPLYQEQVDLNINFIFLNDKLWFGAAYRINQAVAGIVELQVNPQLRIGYSFDYPENNIPQFKYNSHEISLRYEFSYKIKAYNPRYF